MKQIDSMSPDELFAEAAKTRKQIVAQAEQLTRICGLMYAHARRHQTELSSTYVNISNAGRRFAGSVLQGARRTDALDRILDTNRHAIRDAHERETKRAAEEIRRKEVKLARQTAGHDRYEIFRSSNKDDSVDHMIAQSDMSSDLNDLYGVE
jgi:hypothetical protein